MIKLIIDNTSLKRLLIKTKTNSDEFIANIKFANEIQPIRIIKETVKACLTVICVSKYNRSTHELMYLYYNVWIPKRYINIK